jgi:hypothetical protein
MSFENGAKVFIDGVEQQHVVAFQVSWQAEGTDDAPPTRKITLYQHVNGDNRVHTLGLGGVTFEQSASDASRDGVQSAN